MTNETPHRLKIAFTLDGLGVDLWSNDRTLYFSREMWGELLRMADTMECLNLQEMANFTEPEPTLHGAPIQQDHLDLLYPRKPKATLKDLA